MKIKTKTLIGLIGIMFSLLACRLEGNMATIRGGLTQARVPSVVSNFKAVPGDTYVVLSWSAPISPGTSTITRYQVSSDNGATWITASSNDGHTFTDLTNGTQYTFRVRAVNREGAGVESAQTVAPHTLPGEVSNFTATPGNGQVVLSWEPPFDNGGSAITGYQVSSNNGATWETASSDTGHTFTGLSNVTQYTFRVRAVNAAGGGGESVQTVIPVAVPGPVSNFKTTPGNGQVYLSWDSPSNNGGSAITHYQVSSNDGITWVRASSNTDHTFTGLSNGTQYTFKVCAVNEIGAGTENTQTATPGLFTVSFNTRAPAVNNPANVTVICGQPYGILPSLTPPTVIGANVTFNGWWTGLTDGTQVTSNTNVIITANQTLYARWNFIANTYNIGTTGPGTGLIYYTADGQGSRPLGFTVEGYTGAAGSFSSYTAYYLEAAPVSSGERQWGAFMTLISGVTTITSVSSPDYNKIGNGRKDTRTIVAHLGATESGRAAQIAASASFGGLNDWFLPSSGELNQLYINRAAVGNMETNDYFWSSSQSHDSYYAWYQRFRDGGRNAMFKDNTNTVRAVRAF